MCLKWVLLELCKIIDFGFFEREIIWNSKENF